MFWKGTSLQAARFLPFPSVFFKGISRKCCVSSLVKLVLLFSLNSSKLSHFNHSLIFLSEKEVHLK